MAHTVTLLGSELRINSTIIGSQTAPASVALKGGGSVITWTSTLQDGSGDGVYGQRYDATGATVGPEFRINTFTAGNQSAVSVTALSDGGFVAVWRSDGQDGAAGGIYGQRYSAARVALGGEFRVNTITAGDQVTPSVAGLSTGGFVVSWFDGSARAQGYGAGGAPTGGELIIEAPTSTSGPPPAPGYPPSTITTGPSAPSLAALENGEWVAVWRTTRSQSGAPESSVSRKIVAQRYSATGEAIGSLITLAEAGQLGGTGPIVSNPAVAALPGGGFAVAWALSFGQSQIVARNVDAQGNVLGAAQTLGQGADPAVAATTDGGYMVSWTSGGDIKAQNLNAAGQKVGSELAVNAYTTGQQLAPSVLTLPNGSFVTWQSEGQDGFVYGIYGRYFGNPQANATLSVAPEQAVGSAGDDVILAAPGAVGQGDVVDGGSGKDTLRLAAAGVLDVSLATIRNLEVLDGSSGDDSIVGDVNANRLVGGGGADQMTGGGGSDVFVLAAAGDSTITRPDTITDFTLTDQLDFTGLGSAVRVTTAQLGAATYVYADVNGDGVQDALVIASSSPVFGTNILTAGSAGVTMFGDGQANGLFGTDRADTFIAGDGDDLMGGGRGADAYYGGAGQDRILLGLGDSSLSAIDVAYDFVSGSDSIDVSGLAGARLVLARFGGSGFLYIDRDADGYADEEFISYLGLIQGSDLVGAGALTIYGSTDADALIKGGNGADVIAGFDGADVIVGGAGADQLYGGAGADQFRYEALTDSRTAAGTFDFIQDFEVGIDKIDIRALNTGAASTFTRSLFNGSTFVYVDQNGDGTQDFLVIAAGQALSDVDILWI